MNDDQFRQILDTLDLSWQGYRKVRKGVIKRLVRHMQQIDVRDVGEYMERIRSRSDVRNEVKRLTTVSISRFFRDRPLWRCIEKKIIPDILSRRPGRVHVWSAGCALGQEAYSFSLLWFNMEKTVGMLPPLSMLATDINQDYLDMAISGIYDKHVIKDIPQDFTNRMINAEHGQVKIMDHIKNHISWQFHDLTWSSPPDPLFQIIFLRNNLLTYYKKEIQKTVFRRVINALANEGYLIIGTREKLPADYPDLIRIGGYPCVFQKISVPEEPR